MENKDNQSYEGSGSCRYSAQNIREERMKTQREVNVEIFKEFLDKYSPIDIEKMLGERVLGQEELVKEVSIFLYYHALRVVHPSLPMRPLLIMGPTGSGKTEIMRIAKKLFPKIFHINIVDGSTITRAGWAGNNKVTSGFTHGVLNGGILVIDEFDKLSAPQFTQHGDNVGAQMQNELLKILEGEGLNLRTRNPNEPVPFSIVLVGAFESIRRNKEKVKRKAVGFNQIVEDVKRKTSAEELIEYGVIPELMGRISAICETNELSDDDYINIIRSPHSRISYLINILSMYNSDFAYFVSVDALKELIGISKENGTGVRWVLGQIESKILEEVRTNGLKGFLSEEGDEVVIEWSDITSC